MLNHLQSTAASRLADMLRDGQELALLDLREEGIYARAHLLFATPLPLSQLEERIHALVPRRKTRIVLVGDDSLVVRGARRLHELGYTDVSWLDGGMQAWAEKGYELISGVNVPSKLFGEYVQAQYETPHIDPQALQQLLDRGDDILIVDSRPSDEFFNVSIPGAVNCPGAELVYRVPEAVKSDDTLVVVNCAGRTRSIIGCQSLLNAGLKNRVLALRNGTIGWHLAGLPLAHGKESLLPPPSAATLATTTQMTQMVAQRFGVRSIDSGELANLAAQAASRTLYILDVRSPQEYARGHLHDSLSAPGGQLVQATDQYIGTRHARIVLVDTDGVRATMTASWLVQMGWRDVYVHTAPIHAMTALDLPAHACAPPPPYDASLVIGPVALRDALDSGTANLVDLSSSLEFRTGHIPGARFAIRSRLAESLLRLPPADLLVLTSSDSAQAWRAVKEAEAAVAGRILVLEGGTQAWSAIGLPLTGGMEPALEPPDDLWYRPTSPHGGGEDAMRQYISWELELFERLLHEPGLEFHDIASSDCAP